MRTFYITTSIPYVNGEPHIGHALEFVQADTIARYHRSIHDDVFFLSGTDDNALKNVQAAEAAKRTPREWVDEHAAIFQNLLSRLNVSNDDFIRTSLEERHLSGAQKLWSSCKKEDIYKKKYQGLYCLGCEAFKTDKDLVTGECPEHPGKKLEIVEEENYFFKLSNYQEILKKIIESDKLQIIPKTRKNEILSFIDGGLEDFSISRNTNRSHFWGIPVPGDDTQVMYVWFDALSNYINAPGYAYGKEKYKKYWEKGDEIVHMIGKGIIRFHAIYWPAILLSSGIRLPNKIFVHGYLTINGQKISKTLGNVIDPFEAIEKYGTDSVRYYLLCEPSFDDGDFSYDKFQERYNGELANGLGNFSSRVVALASKIDFASGDLKINPEVDLKIQATQKGVAEKLDEFKFHEALSTLWELISFGDSFVNSNKPWETKDKNIIFNLVVLLDNIGAMLQPFLPETSEKIKQRIEWKDNVLKVTEGKALFPRI